MRPPPRAGAAARTDDPIALALPFFTLRLSQLRYLTFSLVGVALLWPWNCFLSAAAYYGTRFANSSSLVRVYSSTMMTVSTLTATVFNYYLSQVQKGVNYHHRLNAGLLVTTAVFTVMAFTCVMYLFVHMNDYLFFGVLMLMVFVSTLATCLSQNGTMAIVNVLGGIYANAVMVGQAVAGVLPSVALILSILVVGENSTQQTAEKNYGVFVYYITASLVSLASISMVWWMNHITLQHSYTLLDEAMEEDASTVNEDDEETLNSASHEPHHVPFGLLWSKLKYIVATIFLTFSITLIFPVFASTVESVHTRSSHRFFHKDIFIPFIYLVWNLGDLLGRVLCGSPKSGFLIRSPRTLIIYALARLVFIPLFLTCNIHPAQPGEPSTATINSDLWYILLQLVFGISNGQLCTSSFMIVGDFCDTDDEKKAAGGFTSVFLSVGLAAGSLFSYVLVLVIS